MTKEDYMKLSKERLAELLAERDNEPWFIPYLFTPVIQQTQLSCYAPDGICMNPQKDCINCPKHGNYGLGTSTSFKVA